MTKCFTGWFLGNVGGRAQQVEMLDEVEEWAMLMVRPYDMPTLLP